MLLWAACAGLVLAGARLLAASDAAGAGVPGLVAAYGFEEGAGTTTADATGTGHAGTVSGASWITTGRNGNALSFDGVNDWVTVADANELDLTAGMTIEAWVYPTATNSAWRTVLAKEKGGDLAYAMQANSTAGRPYGLITTTAEQLAQGSAPLPANAWSHMTTTYDGATVRLYVNGALVGTKTTSGSIATTNLPLHIGGNSGNGEWFQGRLDDIRIYNRPLTATEIQTDMNTAVGPGPPPPPGDQVGSWTPPTNMPLVAVHSTLLPNGRVAMWSGAVEEPGSEVVFDPATETFQSTPSTRNLFCAVTVKLPDGRMAVFGGHTANFNGINDLNFYDYRTNRWQRGPDMSRGRWYPSATMLSDGRILVLSGDNYVTQAGQPEGPLRHPSSTLPEIYDPATNQWSTLPGAARIMPYYPQMFVLPDGRVFDAGPDTTTRTLNLATGTWSTVGTSPIGGHSAVMYRPGKILKSGTWADPEFPNLNVTNRAAVIDMTAASPAWRETSPMANPRSYHNLILLPNGTVMALGGDTTSRGTDPSSGVLEPEIWDPATEVWTAMAHQQVARMYHQTSLLLPDGRVLLSGSGANFSGPDERSYEIFSPPYLHKGARPSISGAPGVVRYGTPFTIDTPDAARIASVSLVRMGSETHSVDQDQRFMWLNFTRNGGALTVDAPANGNVAPPGWYMVFVVDDQGVPSVASIVQVPVGGGDVTAPSAPGNLTATGQLGGVRLNWSASTDNVGVVEYRVHRSTTAGFTPSAANRVATVGGTTTTYTDLGLAAGTYHYVVVAADAAGNTAPSAQASGTAQADTTAPTVSLTAPAAGSTISGVASVAATASDDVGVQSVQFKLDGANLGAPDTTAPYDFSWDTRTASNAPHSLTAVAVDAAGNQKTSTAVSVTVNNPTGNSGLVAAYAFEEDTGTTTADQTGLGHTGTLAGPTRSASGKFGRGLSFDGVNDWVTVADQNDLDLTTGMTIEAWVLPTATNNAWRTVLAKELGNDLSYAMQANSTSGRPYSLVNTTGEQLAQGPAPLPANTWSHMTATYDGSALRLYVNGALVTTTPAIGSIVTSNSPLHLGGNSGLGEWFQGTLDDVRVYNRALSEPEIQTDMNTPAGQPAPTDVTPPSAPGNLAATDQLGGVRLNWSASTDNVGVTEYRVHRSTTAAFTPSAANRVATVGGTTTTYTDSVAAGTYYYIVVAADAAGNTASSAQASGTALADTTAPSAPGNLTATDQLGGVRLNWSASTDNVGVTEYRVHRSTTAGFTPSAANRVATVGGTTTTYTDSVAAGTYYYIVVAADAAGNTASSAQASGTALADTTAPTVSLTSPAAGATVSGVVSVAATASDDVGVQSVQFKLDGANLGAPDTTAPYGLSWDTRTASDASHSLSAVAVDAAGNQTTSSLVSVTVNNPTGAAGLVAAYGFSETSGTTTADQTGLGHTGTVSGALRSATGKFGRALTFDGINDWVTVADQNDLDLTTGMTVEAWVYPTTTNNAWRTVLAKEQPGGLAYSMFSRTSSPGRPCGIIFTSGTEQLAQGSASLPANAWSHLTSTYDGSALRLYVNGTLVATKPTIGSIITTGSPLRFGGSGLGEWFKGSLDDIRIYNRPLSTAEIQADMNTAAG